ncbi:hypothetical protein ASPFODRAFT_441770 [Aspergillus luchuensis CBS 106.47]|uniref:Uncharacterized protein n=1 Tax=Aspergillus luchuensis (strain CBS 106.47) TaxID=1137211 RepID=A0A1M3TWG7_ASPLC|nr:hypothetical protein ASPFODRAFT_441770 [Aspergillus luchuensis CBS 106.47]
MITYKDDGRIRLEIGQLNKLSNFFFVFAVMIGEIGYLVLSKYSKSVIPIVNSKGTEESCMYEGGYGHQQGPHKTSDNMYVSNIDNPKKSKIENMLRLQHDDIPHQQTNPFQIWDTCPQSYLLWLKRNIYKTKRQKDT